MRRYPKEDVIRWYLTILLGDYFNPVITVLKSVLTFMWHSMVAGLVFRYCLKLSEQTKESGCSHYNCYNSLHEENMKISTNHQLIGIFFVQSQDVHW